MVKHTLKSGNFKNLPAQCCKIFLVLSGHFEMLLINRLKQISWQRSHQVFGETSTKCRDIISTKLSRRYFWKAVNQCFSKFILRSNLRFSILDGRCFNLNSYKCSKFVSVLLVSCKDYCRILESINLLMYNVTKLPDTL